MRKAKLAGKISKGGRYDENGYLIIHEIFISRIADGEKGIYVECRHKDKTPLCLFYLEQIPNFEKGDVLDLLVDKGFLTFSFESLQKEFSDVFIASLNSKYCQDHFINFCTIRISWTLMDFRWEEPGMIVEYSRSLRGSVD